MAKAVVAIKLTPAGWSAAIKNMSPNTMGRIFRKHVRHATKRNAIRVQAMIRRTITNDLQPPNAPLTKAIKGGNKPGVHSSDLWNSITYDVKDWNHAFVGVKRTAREYNVANIVHYGQTIKVTRKMRFMFFQLFLASQGNAKALANLEGRAKELWDMAADKTFYPLKETTNAIVIPARPFVEEAMKSTGLQAVAREEWNKALGKTLKEIAKKSGKG